MPEVNPTPQGGADGGAAAPQVTDERSAAAALEGLLDFDEASGDDAGDQDTGEGREPGSGESQTTGEEEGHSEPGTQQAPAIEPPKSWPADEQAKFRELPPAIQAIVAKRESEREVVITQRAQEAADSRKALDAERTAAQGQLGQYMQALQQLTVLALPEAQQFQNLDWAKLAAENPSEYVRLQGLREQLRGRVGAINAEIQRVTQVQQQQHGQRMQEHLAQERDKLVAAVPEFGDATKAKALSTELSTWLAGEGFSPAEIGNATDHRLIKLALKGMRADQAEKARAAAAAKQTNTPPRLQTSGSAAREDRGDAKVKAAVGRLTKTNSVRDAAALLMEVL